MVLEEKDFSFDYRAAYPDEELTDAYERLFWAALKGDQTLFVSSEEIEACWRFIDPILKEWKRRKTPLVFYAPGTWPIQNYEIVIDQGVPKLSNTVEMTKKEIGVIGLGKMGKGIAARLAEKGWRVVAFDPSPRQKKKLRG